MRAVIWGVMAVTAMGCGPSARDDSSNDGDPADDGDLTDDATDGVGPDADTGICQAMDIVFVVDDSASMSQEQANLAANFPAFAQVLADYRVDGQALDFRVAVTTTGRTLTTIVSNGPLEIPTTEQGDNGAFRDGCGVDRRWLEPTDATLSSALACRADVGIDGPSYEQPLAMSMMALDERIVDGTNAGFLRDDALLAVVMLTDEDDCSRTDDDWAVGILNDPCTEAGAPHVLPADTIAFFDALKGGRGRWASAVIAAPADCESDFGDAVEANKLKQLVSEMNLGGGPQNGVFASICDGDLAPALAAALDTFQAACESFPPVD